MINPNDHKAMYEAWLAEALKDRVFRIKYEGLVLVVPNNFRGILEQAYRAGIEDYEVKQHRTN